MFNEFTQFNRNTLQGGGGSGLGLWICRNLATLHGGRLVGDLKHVIYSNGFHVVMIATVDAQHFESAGEGEGSTFIVELPTYLKSANSFLDSIPSILDVVSTTNSRPASSSNISLRIVPIEEDEDRLTGDEVIDLESGNPSRDLTILIVDDSSPNRLFIRSDRYFAWMLIHHLCCILLQEDRQPNAEEQHEQERAGRLHHSGS